MARNQFSECAQEGVLVLRGSLSQIRPFFKRHGRLPDILSASALERELASWLIRFEHRLMPASGHMPLTIELVNGLTGLESLMCCESSERRLAQWHWWSLCANVALARHTAKSPWQSQLVQTEINTWVELLGRNPLMNWAACTEADQRAGRVASPSELALQIQMYCHCDLACCTECEAPKQPGPRKLANLPRSGGRGASHLIA